MLVRLEHDLHTAPFTSEDEVMSGSRVIACKTLANWRRKVQCASTDVNESLIDESNGIADAAFEFIHC